MWPLAAKTGATVSSGRGLPREAGLQGRDVLAGGAVAVQHGERPLAGRGEEPVITRGRRDDLGGELAGLVEQPDVRRPAPAPIARHEP